MSGDGPPFPAFFERHHAGLSRLAYLLTGDASVADDLAADALAQVRGAWPSVATDDPAAYARGAVVALARHHGPRWQFSARSGPEGARSGPEDARSGPEDLRIALRRLPYRRRACVVLRYGCGLTEGETARALGITVGTVRSRTSRGVRQLSALTGGSLGVTRPGGWEAARF